MSVTKRQKPIKASEATYVICVNNTHAPASLELQKLYLLSKDREVEAKGLLRVIDESGEDYVYPKSWFVRAGLRPRVRAILCSTKMKVYRLSPVGKWRQVHQRKAMHPITRRT